MKKRFISLCLAVVMVFSLLPVTAFAEQYVTFGSFEELKELIEASNGNEEIRATYCGDDDVFVFSEDIEIPFLFDFYADNVIIPEGITVTAYFDIFVTNLTIDGSMVLKSYQSSSQSHGTQIIATKSLTVNGHLELQSGTGLHLDSTCRLTNPERIVYDQNSWLDWYYYISDADGLKAALQAAASDTQEHVYYQVLDTDAASPIVIDSNLHIPQNTELRFYTNGLTIARGCVLTNDGTLFMNNSLAVDGVLDNNGRVYINCQEDNWDGSLSIGESGVCRGSGTYVFQTDERYGGLDAWVDRAYSEYPFDFVLIWESAEDQVITDDMVIPANMDIDTGNCGLIIPEGVTLTVNSDLTVNSLDVYGTLVNNYWLVTFGKLTVSGTFTNNNLLDMYHYYGGSLQIEDSGIYEGNGAILIQYAYYDDLEAATEGLDLTGFDAVYNEEGYYWCLTPKAEAHTHSWGDGTVTTTASCTADGVKTYTCACGESKTEAIPAAGHSEVTDAAVEATCTTSGLTEGKHCEICGEVLTAQQTVPAKGHTYENGTCVNCGKAEGTTEVEFGDASGDGQINNVDAMLILQYAVGLKDQGEINYDACDVNNDGVVNNIDAMLILQYAVGLITEFPNAK